MEKLPVIRAVGWFKNVRQQGRCRACGSAEEKLSPIEFLGRVIKPFKPLNDAIHYCADREAGNQMFFCTRHILIFVEVLPRPRAASHIAGKRGGAKFGDIRHTHLP